MGVLKFPKLGLIQLWRPITLCADLQLRWGLKQRCNPCQDLLNGMWHATCTQGDQGDSRLLVVGSQIGNLTPSPSLGHNLYFNYPNVSCKPISDIYVPRSFQWYNFCLIQWILTLAIALWRFGSPSGLQFPKRELTWECGGSFPHTLPHSREHEIWLSSFTFGLHLHKPLNWSRAQG